MVEVCAAGIPNASEFARPRVHLPEHDPEKHALGPRPDGWVAVFPRDKREAFARRSCSNKKIERDDDAKKSHPAGSKAAKKPGGARHRQPCVQLRAQFPRQREGELRPSGPVDGDLSGA